MSVKFIVNGFVTVVAVLIGLGVWGWYASGDSRAQVERIRETRRMRVFCEEYRGVDDLQRIYAPELVPPATNLQPEIIDPSVTVPGATDPGATDPSATDPGAVGPGGTSPGVIGPGGLIPGPMPPSTYLYDPIQMVDLERFESNAPAAVEDEIIEVVAAAEEQRETGNAQAFADPGVQRSVEQINAFGAKYCP